MLTHHFIFGGKGWKISYLLHLSRFVSRIESRKKLYTRYAQVFHNPFPLLKLLLLTSYVFALLRIQSYAQRLCNNVLSQHKELTRVTCASTRASASLLELWMKPRKDGGNRARIEKQRQD